MGRYFFRGIVSEYSQTVAQGATNQNYLNESRRAVDEDLVDERYERMNRLREAVTERELIRIKRGLWSR